MDRSEWGNDDDPVRPPLPPEDRVWRHPSELRAGSADAFVRPEPTRSRGPLLIAAATAGVLVVGATGASLRFMSDDVPQLAAERNVSTLVSVVSTSTAAPAPVPDAGITLVATVPAGERTSAAIAVDETTAVTTMSAVVGATALALVGRDGRKLVAEVLGSDPDAGVAVLGVTVGRLKPDTTASAVPVVAGDRVYASGDDEPVRVEAIGRHSKAPGGARMHHLLRLDLDARSTSEGQAITDADGAVVALCARDAKGEMMGVPVDLAVSAARSLRAHGALVLPWIGVSGRDAAADEDRGWPDGGALLTGVSTGGPAAQAGLEKGDVVIALGSAKVRSISALVLAARAYDAGAAVDVELMRDGDPLTITLILGRLP